MALLREHDAFSCSCVGGGISPGNCATTIVCHDAQLIHTHDTAKRAYILSTSSIKKVTFTLIDSGKDAHGRDAADAPLTFCDIAQWSTLRECIVEAERAEYLESNVALTVVRLFSFSARYPQS
jgi:hypothetical protein